MKFRNSVNALRALAVTAVVLFHFKIAGFTGGFVGVDVFFVISGFLMTGIIFNGLRAGEFSIWSFYASRARRIIPALAVLCIAIIVFGFVYLSLSDYRELLRTVKDSLLFVSNITFAKGGSYFDAPLQENWLLHTWSLSVEWQFYIVYPVIVLWLFRTLGEQYARIGLAVIGVSSLLVSILVTPGHPVFAFYMLPTRAWEMIAGGMVFLYPISLPKLGRTGFELTGLALILLSIFGFSEQDFWPGYLAIIPVLGTAMVIYANSDSLFSRNGTVQFVGSISYSVYLWHWPLVVFLYTCGMLSNLAAVIIGVLLSICLGYASYRVVECRTASVSNPRHAIFKYGGVSVALVVLSAITASVVKDKPEVRFAFQDQGQPAYASTLYSQQCQPNEFGAADCKLGTGEVKAILFGDSHAQSTAAAVQLANKHAALGWARGGCPTLLEFEMQDKELEANCHGFNAGKFLELERSNHGIPVIMFSRAGLYSDHRRENSFRIYFNGDKSQDEQAFAKSFTEEYTKTVCTITKQQPVYIVRPIPEMPFSVYKGLNLQSRILGLTSDIKIPLSSYLERNRLANSAIDTAAATCGATIIDPVPYLCPNGQCMGSKDGVPLYFDDNHLVDAGNEVLKGMFDVVFENQLHNSIVSSSKH